MVVTQCLNEGWEFREHDASSEEPWRAVASIPGSIHKDLQHQSLIPDPFVDMNELSSRWVPERTWSYKIEFQSPASGKGSTTDLVFKGLDTLATVSLNGKKILDADNMFLEYRVNISESLRESGSNELVIDFAPALLRGRELVKEHADEHRFIAHQTENGRLPIRKAQYHWGWDWGPIIVSGGIWRDVWLESYTTRIDDVWHQSEVNAGLTTVAGKLFARLINAKSTKVRLALSLDGQELFTSEEQCDSDGLCQCNYAIDSPKLWWPAGYGPQIRYELKATVLSEQSDPISSSKSIGFRRVELIQEKDDFGKSFYFRLNNVEVFSGGCCWIPADTFLSEVSPQKYRDWMKLMIRGNQIMIRVWGGGIYEDDVFFDACDELGILAWQDFCFACQSTPTYPSFLKQIEDEARYNIRRLRNHPSLVIWAGNNEDYQIQERYKLDYNYDTDKDPESWLKSSFPARYIYEHFLPKIVSEEDPTTIYHPSSPWGDGKPTADPTVGDIHQWNIWHGTMNRYQQAASMTGRFVSEFGMEGYPHLQTIKSAITDPRQQYPGSVVMDYHNRAIDHERRLITYVAENFRIDYDLARFTHLTQLVQADAMIYAYRSWRRQWGKKDQRQCGGVLVWQLNDCWPTTSWAVVDYYLVPKPSYYAIKRCLAKLAVGVVRPYHPWTPGHVDPTIAINERGYEVWVASNSTQIETVNLEIRFISIATGKDLVASVIKPNLTIEANGTTELLKTIAKIPAQPSAHEQIDPDDEETFAWNQASWFRFPAKHRKGIAPYDMQSHDPYVIHVNITNPDTKEVLSVDTAWPDPIKYIDFSDRGVQVLVKSENEVSITASKPVKGFVFQEVKGGGWLSDNGFDVMPGEEKVVEFEKSVGEGRELRWTYLGAESGAERL